MIETRSASAPLLLLRSSPVGEGGAEAAGESLGTLTGWASVFNEWTEISGWEGNFMERVAPGAFAATLARDRSSIKVLYAHGRDPSIGEKPLGVPTVLREDDIGLRYEVPLVDAGYVRELVPALRARALGASFRFSVMRESLDERPPASAYNERALPERTLIEVRLHEISAVTFPAYAGATAGVRTLDLAGATTSTAGNAEAWAVTFTAA